MKKFEQALSVLSFSNISNRNKSKMVINIFDRKRQASALGARLHMMKEQRRTGDTYARFKASLSFLGALVCLRENEKQ